jgi:hypothetical protein
MATAYHPKQIGCIHSDLPGVLRPAPPAPTLRIKENAMTESPVLMSVDSRGIATAT